MQRRLSSLGRLTLTALLGLGTALGCEAIAGYNDVEPRPPGFAGGKAGAKGASGATGATGASGASGTGTGAGGGQVGAAGSGGRPNSDARPDTPEPDSSSGGTTSADASIDTGPEDADSGPCPILVGGNACTGIHRFTASRQVIDGYGDEFCDIPAMVFDVNDCPTMIPSGELPNLPEKVYLRAAWSQRDFHLHVKVEDPNVVVNPADASLWNGDAVEIYIAGTSGTGLTGSYDGTDDGGAIQIVLAPPGAGQAARGQAFFNPGDGRHTSTRIDQSSYAGRLTSDGYELELIYTWALIAEPRVPGAKIAFDLAVGAQQIADAGGRQLQCIISNVFVDGALACGYRAGVPAQPWCDNRTWCQPELLP
jgi:hypothetical protein